MSSREWRWSAEGDTTRGRLGFRAEERSCGLNDGGGEVGEVFLIETCSVCSDFTACVSSSGAEIIDLEMEGPALRRECAAPLTCILCFVRLRSGIGCERGNCAMRPARAIDVKLEEAWMITTTRLRCGL